MRPAKRPCAFLIQGPLSSSWSVRSAVMLPTKKWHKIVGHALPHSQFALQSWHFALMALVHARKRRATVPNRELLNP